MQLIGTDKFKFYPVQFGKTIIPLGSIKSIREYKRPTDESQVEQVEISTYDGGSFYPYMTLEQAKEIWTKAFAMSEY